MKYVTIERIEECWVKNAFAFTFSESYVSKFNEWTKAKFGNEVPEVTIDEVIDLYNKKVSKSFQYIVEKDGFKEPLSVTFEDYINEDIWDGDYDVIDSVTENVTDHIHSIFTMAD